MSDATNGSGPSSAAATVINEDGLRIPGSWTGTLDVVFDGQRVWSFCCADHPVGDGGARRLEWPGALRPHLDGASNVTLREHVTGKIFADHVVAFGSGRGPVQVVDRQGLPLAVTKWGRMNHPFETAGSEAVGAYLDQVEEVLGVIRDECRLPAFLCYGNLLGAVREGKLIGHDVDADLAYLSGYEHPSDVIRETFLLERAFRRRGWKVRRENGGYLALFLSQPDGTTRNMDVFSTFFVEDWLYQVHDIRAQLPRSAILPLGSVQLEGREFPAPAEPPALLEAAYGPNWQTPDPSFQFKSPPATLRRIRGWLGGLRDHRDYWDHAHGSNARKDVPPEPAEFAEWTGKREPDAALVVDVGCGSGRDAAWFAESGYAILGLDYSDAGIRAARTTARKRSLAASFELCNLYDLRHVLAMGARLAADDRPKVLYSRFVVEALEDQGRHYLWRLTEMALRNGGHLYVEFRARKDARTPDIPGEHVRRLLTPESIIKEIESRGGRIEHHEAGHKSAQESHRSTQHRDDNPYVCRLVASWK